MATLALNSGLWVRRLLIGGSPLQGRFPASEVNDGPCLEKPDNLIAPAKLAAPNCFLYLLSTCRPDQLRILVDNIS